MSLMQIVRLSLLDGRSIWVNLAMLLTATEDPARGTKLVFSGGTAITVQQTPDEIAAKAERAVAMQ